MREEVLHQNNNASRENSEVDLLELFNILWEKKLFIIAVVAAFSTCSVLYSFSLVTTFRAEALLSVNEQANRSQIQGQLGVAANLAGVSLEQVNKETVNALAILQSREFVNKFIVEHDLLPWLFASEFEGMEVGSVIDSEIYDLEKNVWMPPENPSVPTDGQAYRKFIEILSITESPNTGLVSIAIEWPDPVFAARWTNWLIEDINDHIRAGDKQEAQLAIEYLQNQLANTQLLEMQRVFYQLIEIQTRTLMLADIREGYVFEVIDPAVVPEEKFGPRRSLIFILGTLLGVAVSAFLVLVSQLVSRRR